MNSFCEKCGSPVNPGAVFCRSCGQKLGEAANPNAQPQYAPQPQYAQPEPQYEQPQYEQPQYSTQPQYVTAPKSRKTLFIILAAVVLVAAIVVTLLLVLGGPSVDPEKLNGSWEGTISLDVVNDGAEVIGITRDSIGDDADVQIELDLDEDGEGTMTVYPYECEASYKGGRLTAEQKDTVRGGISVYFEGSASESKDSYTMQGNWRFTDDSGKVLASGTWHAELN